MYRALVAQERLSFEENNDKENKCSDKKRQSPINIVSKNCRFDSKKCDAKSFDIQYVLGDCEKLVISPGKGWMVSPIPTVKTSLTASHLPGTYRFSQFHAHWSSTSHEGSEHKFDGKSYAGEVHFVFWNTTYASAQEAVNHGDGLAVVGVFLQEGEYNAHYAHISSEISQALSNGNETLLKSDFDMRSLIPIGSDLVHYEGSLTTPPYTECVMWTVLLNPVEVSSNQLFHFRKICSSNWRECQHLCGREIFSSKSF